MLKQTNTIVRRKTKTKSLSYSQQWATKCTLHYNRFSGFIALRQQTNKHEVTHTSNESIQLQSAGLRWEFDITHSYISLFELLSIHEYMSYYYSNNNDMWESIDGARIQWDHNGYSIIKIILTRTHARNDEKKWKKKKQQRIDETKIEDAFALECCLVLRSSYSSFLFIAHRSCSFIIYCLCNVN